MKKLIPLIVCAALALLSIAAVNVVPSGGASGSFSFITNSGNYVSANGTVTASNFVAGMSYNTTNNQGAFQLYDAANRVGFFYAGGGGGAPRLSLVSGGYLEIADSTTAAGGGIRLSRSAGGNWFANTNFTVGGSYNSTASLTGTNMTTLAGRVTLAATAQTYIVTNSQVTANSIVLAVVNSDDATVVSVKAIPGTGILTLKANGVAAANTTISYWIITP